jgi:transposase
MAHGKLKSKVPQLVEALNDRVTEHHRFLLRFHLDNIAFQLDQIQELDEEIQRHMVPFQKENYLIKTLPGISKTSAAAIIAKIGTNMSQFPDEAHLLPGLECVLEIMRVQESRKAERFEKVMDSSKVYSLKLLGPF